MIIDVTFNNEKNTWQADVPIIQHFEDQDLRQLAFSLVEVLLQQGDFELHVKVT